MTKLAWGALVSPAFRKRVLVMASRDGYDPSHVMAVMYFESKLKASAINRLSGASGLIQFMPSTALDLNTTIEDIRNMTELEQLDYVDRYFHRYSGKLKTLSDTYMAVLWPRAVGKPEDYVLFEKGSKAYEQNKALDLDNDGKITKSEATHFVELSLEKGMQQAVEETLSKSDEEQEVEPIQTIAGVAGLFNPLAGGLIGLAGEIFKTFAPDVQKKLTKEINRHTDNPETGAQIIADFSKMIINQAKVLTGKSDDFQAAAAITSDPAQSENLKKIEASVEDRINSMKEAGDKISVWDQALWDAQNKGRQVVSTIAIEEKKAGLYDMTALLARTGSYTVMGGTGLLLLTILYQSVAKYVFKAPDAQGVDPVLIAFAAPLITMAYQGWKDIVAYRFDGTKESSDQSKALLKLTK